MFELPEFVTLARQMNTTLKGKTIQSGQLGNSPHKFVWYNRSHEEFGRLTIGKTVGSARSNAKWLFLPIEPGFVLLLGECGGKAMHHPAGSKLPQKYHLYFLFEDNSFFTVTTQMWGAIELFEEGHEENRQYVKGMRMTPIDPEFSFDYFAALIDSLSEGKNRSVKALLTQDQVIPGLGNAIAQDILFHARLHPRYSIVDLDGQLGKLSESFGVEREWP